MFGKSIPAIIKVLTLKPLFLLIFCSTYSFGQNNSLIPYKKYLDSSLKLWKQSFKNFQISRFRCTDTIKFENTPYEDPGDLNEFYSIYKPALTFSNDKSKFIDIYSYWLNLERKGNKLVEQPEVDQAVSLYDSKIKKWLRIYFCGMSTRIEEVIWITNTKFLLAGSVADDKNGQFHPKVLVGDMLKQQFLEYVNKSSVAGKTGYTSLKIEKLHIQSAK